MSENIPNIEEIVKTPDSLSDTSSVQGFADIHAHIDVLHKVTDRLEKERYKNRVMMSVLGVAIVIIQLLDTILKMFKR